MTISKLIKFLWDGLDIPVTEEEIQQEVNELFEEIRKRENDLQIEQEEPKRRIPHLYNNF